MATLLVHSTLKRKLGHYGWANKTNIWCFIVYFLSNRVSVCTAVQPLLTLYCIVVASLPEGPASGVDPCQAAHLRWQYYCMLLHRSILLFFRLLEAQRLVSILFNVIWQRAIGVSLWPLWLCMHLYVIMHTYATQSACNSACLSMWFAHLCYAVSFQLLHVHVTMYIYAMQLAFSYARMSMWLCTFMVAIMHSIHPAI